MFRDATSWTWLQYIFDALTMKSSFSLFRLTFISLSTLPKLFHLFSNLPLCWIRWLVASSTLLIFLFLGHPSAVSCPVLVHSVTDLDFGGYGAAVPFLFLLGWSQQLIKRSTSCGRFIAIPICRDTACLLDLPCKL